MKDCKLCESIKTGKLHNGRCIVKLDENTYELQIWEGKPTSELDYAYELFATTEVKCCPECGKRLGDMNIEELDLSEDTYNRKKLILIYLAKLRNSHIMIF
jgi:hypothetical protein